MRTSDCLLAFAATFAALTLAPALSAHCDSLDGPVILDARAALAAGRPDLVLKWVQRADEAEIRTAFNQALAVRTLSSTAQELADRWFFETLVRIHRSGEGAPYTGLKNAGGTAAGIAAADHALASGDSTALIEEAAHRVSDGLQSRFLRVRTLAPAKDRSIADGRAYVAAYVDFVHFAEAALDSQSHLPATAPGHEH